MVHQQNPWASLPIPGLRFRFRLPNSPNPFICLDSPCGSSLVFRSSSFLLLPTTFRKFRFRPLQILACWSLFLTLRFVKVAFQFQASFVECEPKVHFLPPTSPCGVVFAIRSCDFSESCCQEPIVTKPFVPSCHLRFPMILQPSLIIR